MEIRLIIWRYSSMARISSCLLQEKSSILFIAAMCSSEGLRALRLGDKASNSRGLDLDKSLKTVQSTPLRLVNLRRPRQDGFEVNYHRRLAICGLVICIRLNTKKTKVTSNGREGQSENSLLYAPLSQQLRSLSSKQDRPERNRHGAPIGER